MKRMSWFFGAVVVGVMALTGCSSEEKSESNTASTKGNLTVQGSVSSKLGTDNARAVAIGENGKKIWTFLDKHGDFSLKLPAGQAYRVVIANQLPGGGQKIIGKLKVKDGKSATDVIKAKKEGKIDLGVLRKPETKSSVATKALHVSCGCEDDMGGGDEGGWGDDGGGDDWGGVKGGDGGWGDDTGWGEDGGDWGTEDDGAWGGKGGWEDDYEGGGWDDAADGWDKGGEIDDAEFDHDDDFGCFDDDGALGMDGMDGEDGAGDPDGISEDDMEFDPCDICVAGEPIDLVPSKGGYDDLVDLKSKLSKFEGEDCATFTPKKPIVKDAPVDSKADSIKTIAAKGSDKAVESKKAVGEKCVSKSEVDSSNMCVAGKVVKK